MRSFGTVIILYLTLSDAAQSAVQCRAYEVAGTSQAQPAEAAALRHARRQWEARALAETGQSYAWVMALETGMGVHLDRAQNSWSAWVQGYPCAMRPSSTADRLSD